MKKIFLTSVFANVGDKLLDLLVAPPSNMKVAFINTAAQIYNDKPWLYEDRGKLVEMGFDVIDCDVAGKSEKELREFLDKVDIIFVAGGNTCFLLEKSLKNGFAYLVNEYVLKGKIYIGSSAGSIFAGPSVEPYWEIEKTELPSDFKMDIFSGLHLVDFVIIPHFNQQERKQEFEKLFNEFGKRFDLRPLKDNEALIIEGQNEKLVRV